MQVCGSMSIISISPFSPIDRQDKSIQTTSLTPTNKAMNTKRQQWHLLLPQGVKVIKHCRDASTRRLDDHHPVERVLLSRSPPSLHTSLHAYATLIPSDSTVSRTLAAYFASRVPRSTTRVLACSGRMRFRQGLSRALSRIFVAAAALAPRTPPTPRDRNGSSTTVSSTTSPRRPPPRPTDARSRNSPRNCRCPDDAIRCCAIAPVAQTRRRRNSSARHSHSCVARSRGNRPLLAPDKPRPATMMKRPSARFPPTRPDTRGNAGPTTHHAHCALRQNSRLFPLTTKSAQKTLPQTTLRKSRFPAITASFQLDKVPPTSPREYATGTTMKKSRGTYHLAKYPKFRRISERERRPKYSRIVAARRLRASANQMAAKRDGKGRNSACQQEGVSTIEKGELNGVVS